eukprot:11266216-Alexandrium_andersonii.AAC.1
MQTLSVGLLAVLAALAFVCGGASLSVGLRRGVGRRWAAARGCLGGPRRGVRERFKRLRKNARAHVHARKHSAVCICWVVLFRSPLQQRFAGALPSLE